MNIPVVPHFSDSFRCVMTLLAFCCLIIREKRLVRLVVLFRGIYKKNAIYMFLRPPKCDKVMIELKGFYDSVSKLELSML